MVRYLSPKPLVLYISRISSLFHDDHPRTLANCHAAWCDQQMQSAHAMRRMGAASRSPSSRRPSPAGQWLQRLSLSSWPGGYRCPADEKSISHGVSRRQLLISFIFRLLSLCSSPECPLFAAAAACFEFSISIQAGSRRLAGPST